MSGCESGANANLGWLNAPRSGGGAGGTLSFYLDSATGTPISSVTLLVIGGWQNWETVTGPVSGITGVHNLYIVFTGSSNGIANVNWFQFQ